MTTGVLERRLTTSPDAAGAYRAGVDAFLQLRSGALQHFARALALDPTFALAHAALALMGHELCAPVDVRSRIRTAQLHARRATEAERSHVTAVAGHIAGDRRAIVRHLQTYPGDAVLLSVAVPTIAFAGVTEVPQDAWAVVESCTDAQGGTWFHDGLLAFVRQEQGRYDEAMILANLSLTAAPGSGHAAHARAHVHYETGDHAAGIAWLDSWIAGDGRETDNLVHYAWHAALHELSTGDLPAVEDRYRSQLSPAHVSGCRSLVDTGSLLWRWSLTPGATNVPSIEAGTDVPTETLLRPPTPFVGMHAAIALAAAEDAGGLRSLACWTAAHENPVHRAVISPLATALRLLVLGEPSACADELIRISPDVWRVGGSDAQREVVEETLVTALLRAGRYDEARTLIDARLDRRHCRRDQWFKEAAAQR
ncbi:MAG: pyridine nucleotide-disulfide oxidoreductase [Marmoricola sp.]|nr:pyridine nucleotide-disulfide oxidoreductase [Marmoricola sp.]